MLKQFERHYVRTNEDAKRAVDYVLEHKICGFDTETCPTEAWSQDGKAGLDAYKARIRLVQLAAG